MHEEVASTALKSIQSEVSILYGTTTTTTISMKTLTEAQALPDFGGGKEGREDGRGEAGALLSLCLPCVGRCEEER